MAGLCVCIHVSLFCTVAQGHLKDSLESGRKRRALQVGGGGAAVPAGAGDPLILAGFLPASPLARGGERAREREKLVSLIRRVEKA